MDGVSETAVADPVAAYVEARAEWLKNPADMRRHRTWGKATSALMAATWRNEALAERVSRELTPIAELNRTGRTR